MTIHRLPEPTVKQAALAPAEVFAEPTPTQDDSLGGPASGHRPRIQRLRSRLRRGVQSGQATAEYALVLLGVAFIAVLVLDWARNTNMISRLLDAVFRSINKLIT